MKQRMQKTLWLSLILFFFLAPIVQASPKTGEAEETISPQDLVESQVEKLDLNELKGFWEEITTEYGGFLPESQKGSLYEFIKGEKEFSLKEWAAGAMKFVFHEFIVNGKLLGTLILLTVFSMFLQSLQNSFEKSTVSKAAYSIVFMVLIIIALNSFHVAITYTQETISTMVSFIMALIPLLLALIASSGGVVSAAFFHPVILFLMNVSGLFIQYIILPLLFLSALLSIVSTLSEHYKVTQLANLLRNWSIGLLGMFLTVFLGVISVQGASAAVTDGITIRTAKFITGNFIPVIGRMFTDATDTVISASVLLKNTVGIAGVAILLIIAAFPAIKILMIAFIYKFAAAILQPLGGGPIISCLDIISKSIIYVFAALAIVSLMFFLSITVIIAAGNLTMMVR
ncbi:MULTISPECIES: stage III sporulation protein AE [Cytobacillus]|jgi:stage III sporulation protein AE|uniref:Stage III sporulation protein AE n=3 Tax=Cytobacillus TaxID=2675230 RepID=A0A160ME58_9BACI|nr:MULTISPECIES: stage III sporulation protein AE [Cytobacillus]MBY0154554.1 stage III sporulation protein AE [Cytobacillus firmus]AND41387.1 stage III sporulation protein AE [Cytobacillus oceanisediminis 2691]MBU8731343.1 stage III sporulation protein AE [Cytobacillus oceanisediminis]MCM3242196.1 stage III sporulation protein AE [Cytobacillus oceanisediminis]MCM3393772.1 stage III sporulation protein AE [Cytobacillus oceanisediminis]